MSYAKLVHKRRWMYNRIDERNEVSAEFRERVSMFIQFTSSQPDYIYTGTLFCPCIKCQNGNCLVADLVGKHLYSKEFMQNY